MHYLGNTDLYVSELCFGTLTMTPFQANLSINEGARLLIHAAERGVNFFDTAEIYDNYAYLRELLKVVDRSQVVIASKCYAYDEKTATESLEKALEGLGTDYIDLFMLHEQESKYTLKGHHEALETFCKFKKAGYIRSIGVSTHFIACAQAITKYPEIQVIHPIYNQKGIGIQDGSVEEMTDTLENLHSNGIGIYSMKALGGGHLQQDALESIKWVMEKDFIDSIAVGMQSIEEVDYNIDLILNRKENMDAYEKIHKKKRRLIVADYCIGCGNCVKRCKQDAIHVINGKAVPNDACILCGYCATVCPEFCIKVI